MPNSRVSCAPPVLQVALLTGSQFIITAGFGVIVPVLPTFAAELGMGGA